jgi:hypothetical protein
MNLLETNAPLRNKPLFCINNDQYVLNYGKQEFIIDLEEFIKIKDFFDKTFKLDEGYEYPFYKENNREINILEYLFNFKDVIFTFKNKNKYDLRRENVVCYPEIYKEIINKYNVIDYIQGHYSTLGQQAYEIKNCLWKIKEDDGKEYLLMYCEKDTICKLCVNSYQKVLDYEKTLNNNKNLTWYKASNGYIQTHNFEYKCYYIHQIITGCYGNGKGTSNVSVDHIDQDPLNNAWDNLRIATRDEQEQNSKGIKPGTKRERKHSAKQLPDGITQNMLKKYVVYYKDYADKEKKRSREYFKVEKHPKLNKIWIGTKANNISIQEKLIQANKVVDDLDNVNEHLS